MRLIDADAMHKFAEDKVAEGKDGWANGVGYEWTWTLTAVDMQPTIDAVEVVRCKDCKHFEEFNYCYYHAADENGTPIFVRENDFCSYGERKDGEHDQR